VTVEITGKTGTVSVGELMDLGVKYTKEWGVLKSVEWTIPGKVVSDYVDGASTAKVTPLADADKKKFTVKAEPDEDVMGSKASVLIVTPATLPDSTI